MSFKQNLKRREQMELTVPQAVDYFLTALTLEGKSPATLLWHRKKLTAFSAFVRNGGAPPKICSLAIEDGRAFIKSLMERKTKYTRHVWRQEIEGGLAPQTVHGFVRSMRTFGSWLEREQYTEDNIFKGIKPPKVPQILIQPLTEDEIRRVLLAVPQDRPEVFVTMRLCCCSWTAVFGCRSWSISRSLILTFRWDSSRSWAREQGTHRADGIDSAASSHPLYGARSSAAGASAGERIFLTVAGDPISTRQCDEDRRTACTPDGNPAHSSTLVAPHICRALSGQWR